MDAGLFANMLSDKNIIDLKKLGYKYPQADLKEFVSLLEKDFTNPCLSRILMVGLWFIWKV